jgi:hypothetical protein
MTAILISNRIKLSQVSLWDAARPPAEGAVGPGIAHQHQVGPPRGLFTSRRAGIPFISGIDETKLSSDSNGSAAGGLTLVADLPIGATMTAADIWLMRSATRGAGCRSLPF